MNILGQNFLNKEKTRLILPGTKKSLLKEVALFPMNTCQLPQ